MSRVERSAVVVASPEAIWHVLSDFGALSRWVPMIQHSCLLSEQTDGVGTMRRVQIARQTMVETAVTWDPPSTLAYTIDGLPPMVGRARNTWTLRPAGRVTEVMLATEIDTGRNPAKRLVAVKVLERMAVASEFMLAGLEAAVAGAATTPATAPNPMEAP